MEDTRRVGFEPETIAAKTHLDGRKVRRPLATSIMRATNFQFETAQELGRAFKTGKDNVYLRFGHPMSSAVAEKVAALENAEDAAVFGSGMAAISSALLNELRPGDHVVSQRRIFAQTYLFFSTIAESLGVSVTYVDATDLTAVEGAVQPGTRLIYIESPSNPRIDVIDIRRVAEIGDRHDIPVFVDGTFASPAIQRPLDLGASLVLHSGTKFLGGHSDVMCGVAAGDAPRIAGMRRMQKILGGVLDPSASWLLLRGMRTLHLRVQRQSSNALAIAEYLDGQRGVAAVYYPFLETSPFHAIAREQMSAGGGVVSFEVEGGLKGARRFVDALEIVPIATSLGGVETIVEIPYELDFSEEEIGDAANETGVTPGLIRLSVGIEALGDLMADVERGLSAVRAIPRSEPGSRSGSSSDSP